MSKQLEKYAETANIVGSGITRAYVTIFILFVILFAYHSIIVAPIANDAANASVYSSFVDDRTSNPESFAIGKEAFIESICAPKNYERAGKPFGKTCDMSVNDFDYLKVQFDIDGVQARIKKRNESYRQWRWFNQEPIPMPSYQ